MPRTKMTPKRGRGRPRKNVSHSNEELRTFLEQIRSEAGGTLTDARVVEVASSKDHPLHAYFEWDDGAAAQRFREEQARVLIRRVNVQYSEVEAPEKPAVVVDEKSPHIERVEVRDTSAAAPEPGVPDDSSYLEAVSRYNQWVRKYYFALSAEEALLADQLRDRLNARVAEIESEPVAAG